MFVIQWAGLQWRIFKNRFKEQPNQFLFNSFWKMSFFLIGMAFLYFFLISMFEFSVRNDMPAFDFACIMLSFCLLIFLPLIAYSAIVCSLSFLFQKEEITFYFSLPIGRMQVFMVKFWQIIVQTIWMSFAGFVTFMVAIQAYFKLSPLIYLNGLISGFFFLIIPVCIAVIIVCLLSRFVPFVRAKGILTVVGLLFGSLILLTIRLLQPERLASSQGKMRLLTFVENLHKPWMTVLPSEWVTNIFAAQYNKDSNGIFINSFAIIFISLFLVLLTYVIARACYVHIWSESVSVPEVGCKKSGLRFLLKFFPLTQRMIIQKDIISFYRNTVEKGSLLIFIPLSVVYFYSIHIIDKQLHTHPEEFFFSFLYLYLFNFFYTGVLLCGLGGRWVLPSISSEGSNFKLIKLSPVTLQEFVQSKFWLGFWPLLILGEILIAGSCIMLGLSWWHIILASFVTVVLALGVTLIGIILGTRMADFSIKEPLEFALGHYGLLYLVMEFIFIGVLIILIALPLALFLKKGFSGFSMAAIGFSLFGAGLIFRNLYFIYKRAIICLGKREI